MDISKPSELAGAARQQDASKIANVDFVDPDEFCQLLLSRKSLRRANDIAAHLACLVDHASGHRYAVERSRLFRAG